MTNKQWSQIVAKAWADGKFKQRLLADPAAVLKEHGITLPAGVTVAVLENTDKVLHLVLPAASQGELSEADLEKVAGGATEALSEDAKPPPPPPPPPPGWKPPGHGGY